ncbi:Pdz Domain-Containing Ring Finger Protein 4 [Manis pentadactyla]|nr:Pdz Domain-Containing Ring Finger Protein 4 [Manis pentadactyla]
MPRVVQKNGCNNMPLPSEARGVTVAHDFTGVDIGGHSSRELKVRSDEQKQIHPGNPWNKYCDFLFIIAECYGVLLAGKYGLLLEYNKTGSDKNTDDYFFKYFLKSAALESSTPPCPQPCETLQVLQPMGSLFLEDGYKPGVFEKSMYSPCEKVSCAFGTKKATNHILILLNFKDLMKLKSSN